MSKAEWDPLSRTAAEEVPTATCIKRIKGDLQTLVSDSLYGLFVAPDEADMLNVHALILGPNGSPYEKGFFYFFLRVPADYPWHPPRVRLMTTDGGSVRFNPNLYKDGKVCLSILGTWDGPNWTPALTLSAVLVSIQSLMNEYPYYNEPGFAKSKCEDQARKYNQIVLHETLRVAVVGMLRNDTGLAIPPTFECIMQEKFLDNYSYYERMCQENMHLDGSCMVHIFGSSQKRFNYKSILNDLQNLKTQMTRGLC